MNTDKQAKNEGDEQESSWVWFKIGLLFVFFAVIFILGNECWGTIGYQSCGIWHNLGVQTK